MTDEPDHDTENRLRRALRARDTEVHPSPDALASIQRRGSERRWPRTPLLIAAAFLLLGGAVVAVAMLDGDDTDVAVDGPPTTATDAPGTTTPEAPSTSAPDSSPPPTTVPPPTDPTVLAGDGLIVWPHDSRSFASIETAATAYATEVLGIADPILTYDDCCDDRIGYAHLRAQGEGGRELDHDAALMTLVSTDDTWEIVLVESDTMVIESARGGPTGIDVRGRGLAFEGTGVLTVTSRCDPDSTTTELVAVGAGAEPVSFSATIAAPPCDIAIVRLTAAAAADGATPTVSSTAVPTGAPSDVVVMRVAADDVLNVRSQAGASNEIVATLAPDAEGITLTGQVASPDGVTEWWEITTPDGVTGWANAGFLSVQYPVDDTVAGNLVFAARGLVEALDEDLPPSSPTTLPPPPPPLFGAVGVDVGGIGVYADAPSQRLVSGSEMLSPTVLNWNPFGEPECDAGECLIVEEFLDFEADTLQTATFNTEPIVYGDDNTAYEVGLPPLYTERFATVRIEIPASSTEELDWRTYTVVFDFRNDVPEVIAVWRWGWTP